MTEQKYRTKEGDTVAYIAWKQYGNQNPGTVEAVFEANSFIADYDPELPAGLIIILPDIEVSQPQKVVTLWS